MKPTNKPKNKTNRYTRLRGMESEPYETKEYGLPTQEAYNRHEADWVALFQAIFGKRRAGRK